MLQILYILPLTAALAVALNENRLCLYSFATNCVNIAVIHNTHCVCLEAYALAGQQISFKVFFITQL